MTLTTVKQLDEAVTLVREGLEIATTVITSELAAHDFHCMGKKLTELNSLLNTHAVITTTIGFLADKHHSGNQVGSRSPETYVMKLLGVSRAEARRIIERGKDTYGTPAFTEIIKEIRIINCTTDSGQDTSVDRPENTTPPTTPSLQQRKQEYEQARKVHEEQKKAQHQAAARLIHNTPGEEYLRILDAELRQLEGIAHRQTIRAEALEKTSELTPTEFRYHVRNLVTHNNAIHHDPQAGFKKRYLSVSAPDADGGARITGYLPAPTLALFQQALATANRPDSPNNLKLAANKFSATTGCSEAPEPRRLGQRRVDTLTSILHKRVSSAESRHAGVGSLVVSITTTELQEILNETSGERLTQLIHQPRPTNTAAHISLAELMDLGLAKFDMTCLQDGTTGNALFLGRTKRSATFWQKVALVAEQLVCSHPGCDIPAVNCEVHHIRSWNNGGDTDIDNLTLLCRNHHMDNNDRKNLRTPRGWAEFDPITGRKGHQDLPTVGGTVLPPVRINTGWMARQSAGYKIFTTHKQHSTSESASDKNQVSQKHCGQQGKHKQSAISRGDTLTQTASVQDSIPKESACTLRGTPDLFDAPP